MGRCAIPSNTRSGLVLGLFTLHKFGEVCMLCETFALIVLCLFGLVREKMPL